MTDKKKNKMVLVKLSDMDKNERRAAIKNTRSSLFEETEEQKTAKQNKPVAKQLPRKNT